MNNIYEVVYNKHEHENEALTVADVSRETITETVEAKTVTVDEKIEFIYNLAVELQHLYQDLKPEDIVRAKTVMNGPLGQLLKNSFKR